MTGTEVMFDGGHITIEKIVEIAGKRVATRLDDSGEFVERIDRGVSFLERLLEEDGTVYGVTSGYGDSCTTVIPRHLVEILPKSLYTFHGCGLGDVFDPVVVRAILATRLSCLSKGYSGVRYELLKQFNRLLEHDILPVIPQEGSVGASGDLTPMSYVAAVLCGEREVFYQGVRISAESAFNQTGIDPLTLRPKEALAIMNGTAVMTALACVAYKRAEYLCKLSSRITAMCSVAMKGNAYHFDELLFSVKPHPGQKQIAAWIHSDLNVGAAPRHSSRLQDSYSLRCAPHVIGVLQDSLPWMRQFIEIELNSANDNPIIDGDGEHVLHGGHFYGGHIAFVMDSLKNCVANLADLLDRQLAQLVDEKFNHGLPPNLTGAPPGVAAINHGFKAVQIGVSAWTAEALKQTMPASVFSRSTECHNQDKVSMGTIAARDCIRVIELTEQVAAAMLLAVSQGVNLRVEQGEIESMSLSDNVRVTLREVENVFEFMREDRALESTLREVIALIQKQHWSLYE